MGITNGVVDTSNGGLKITDVVTALGGQANNNLLSICTSTNSNIWARYRPTGYGTAFNRGSNTSKALMYGLSYIDSGGNETSKSPSNILPQVTSGNFNNNLRWNFKPTLTNNRLGDYNGYKHNAQCNISATFFKEETIAGQTGLFKSANIEVLSFIKNSAFSIEPPRQWENHTSSDDIDYCSRLYFEELFVNSTSALYDLYLGLAFKIGDNYKMLSTGQKMGVLLHDNTIKNLSINSVVFGTIYPANGRITMILNFESLENAIGRNFIPVNTEFNARLVLIESGSSSAYVLDTISNAYSFEITNGFCYGTFTLKTLSSYLNIKTYRNDGLFFGGNANEWEYGHPYWDSVRQTYNCDWKPILGHEDIEDKTIDDYCYLQYDSTHDYAITYNNSGVVTNIRPISSSETFSGARYIRYKLKLGGCICTEFKPKPDGAGITENDVIYISQPSVTFGEKAEIILYDVFHLSGSSFTYDAFLIQFGGDEDFNESFVPANTIFPIQRTEGFCTKTYSYTWTYYNKTISTQGIMGDTNTYTQLHYCTYVANNPNTDGNFKRVSSTLRDLSEMKFVNKTTGQQYDTVNSSVYIYFVKSAIGSNTNDIEMDLNYKGFPSTTGGYRQLTYNIKVK